MEAAFKDADEVLVPASERFRLLTLLLRPDSDLERRRSLTILEPSSVVASSGYAGGVGGFAGNSGLSAETGGCPVASGGISDEAPIE